MKPEEITKPCDTAENVQSPAEPAVPVENDNPAADEMAPPVHTEESLAANDEGAEDMLPPANDEENTEAGSGQTNDVPSSTKTEPADEEDQDNDTVSDETVSTERSDTAPSEVTEPAEEEENTDTPQTSEDTENTPELPDTDTESINSAASETNDTRKAHSKKHVFLIILTILTLVLCCALFTVLYLHEPHEPKQPQLTRSAAISAREMPTIPTDPPTEPPTEAPTEPSYEMKLDLSKAQSYHAINEDVVGWIYIDDTVINYPVVQSDDNSYYMERNWQKQYSYSGSIFQDYACDLITTENTLIYGHNMGNGTMFHAIKNYKVEDWGLEHPYVEVSTLDTRYLYKVISVNVLYGDYGASFEYWNCKAMSNAAYTTFVQQIYDTSLVWYGGEELPEYGDEILTLQTCNSGAADGMRCVLFAVRVGEY